MLIPKTIINEKNDSDNKIIIELKSAESKNISLIKFFISFEEWVFLKKAMFCFRYTSYSLSVLSFISLFTKLNFLYDKIERKKVFKINMIKNAIMIIKTNCSSE